MSFETKMIIAVVAFAVVLGLLDLAYDIYLDDKEAKRLQQERLRHRIQSHIWQSPDYDAKLGGDL